MKYSKSSLKKRGSSAVVPEIVFDYKSRGFDVVWSHKSVAYATGLGTFGVHHMLITKAGCAGRFGTLLVSAKIPPTPRPKEEFCCYKKREKCLVCVNSCPAAALSVKGLDKKSVSGCLRKMQKLFPNLTSLPAENA